MSDVGRCPSWKSAEPHWSRERFGVAAFALYELAPFVQAALWRPMVHLLHADADSSGLVSCGLLVTTVALVASGATVGRRAGRWLPAVVAGLAALLLGVGWGHGLPAIGARTLALLGVALFSAALLPWLMLRLPAELDGQASRRKGTVALLVAVSLFAAGRNWQRSVFMSDSTRVEGALLATNSFVLHHSCLTAYLEGARLAQEKVENLYDLQRWPELSHSVDAVAAAARFAPFSLDAFAYPPPFLLLPRFLLTPLDDFAAQRALWFGLNGLVIAVALWVVATWIGGQAGTRVLLLTPLILAGPWVVLALQVGNVHAVVISVAMLALVAFETKRPALGGALLACAIVAKVSPGLLIVLLLVQRRFREVLWTAFFGLVLGAAGLAFFGPSPFIAFVSYELPRLSSGEALSFLSGPDSVPINLAPFGMPFKLEALGVRIDDPWAMARTIGQVFTVAIVAMTAWAGRKRGGRRATAETWTAVLSLASLRSPLAAPYVTLAVVWLLAIRSTDIRGTPRALAEALLWILLLAPPLSASAPALVFSLVQQNLIIVVAAYFLLRRPPTDVLAAPG